MRTLTDNEVIIAQNLMDEGYSFHEIAEHLDIEPEPVPEEEREAFLADPVGWYQDNNFPILDEEDTALIGHALLSNVLSMLPWHARLRLAIRTLVLRVVRKLFRV